MTLDILILFLVLILIGNGFRRRRGYMIHTTVSVILITFLVLSAYLGPVA